MIETRDLHQSLPAVIAKLATTSMSLRGAEGDAAISTAGNPLEQDCFAPLAMTAKIGMTAYIS
jgi:hypothetical protein